MLLADQLRCLVDYGISATGKRSTLSEAAEGSGIHYQTLINMLSGRSDNPRLSTLRSLCQWYGISLAYFDCDSPEACRSYLRRRTRHTLPPLIRTIAEQSRQLSPAGQQNVLVVMDWMDVAAETSG